MADTSNSVIIEAGLRVVDAEAFKKLASNVIEQTRKEPGCLRYDLLQDTEDPNIFLFIEEYKDEEAFQTHRNMPYMAPFRAEREKLLDKFTGLRKLKAL